MKTIQRAETITSSSLPTDFCPNTELTTGQHQSCIYPELHRALWWKDGCNPVPVLGVKGLISRSWFEERNCFYVYVSVYVDLATMSCDAGSY